MKVLVFPGDANPYQGELYGALEASRPVVIRYLEGPTPSQTVNVLLLPVLLAIARARGFRILHVHWVYPFQVTWARGPVARAFVEWWYMLFLRVAAALGFRIVWTAHNLLPHEPVFRDDLGCRRALVDRCDAVIAHAEAAASVVRGWCACRVVVIPQGVDTTFDPGAPTRAAACSALCLDPGVIRALFFGKILDYKGVDLLLEAATRLAAYGPDRRPPLEVVVVGECADTAVRARLESLAAAAPAALRLRTRFTFVPESELVKNLAAADFAVFPFRTVTNSSSVVRALAAGLPVIIPALPALDDVPRAAALRYEPGVDCSALTEALASAATTGVDERAAMAAAATRFAAGRSWPDAAAATWMVYVDVLAGPSQSAGASVATHIPAASR